MSIFRPKSSPIFDAAKTKVAALVDALDTKVELDQNKFFKMIEGDPNSPLIMGIGDNRYLIFYPKNSSPYLHKFETSVKDVEILDGEIWDRLSGKVYKAGDKFKLHPSDNIEPYTKNSECYVRVHITTIDSIWDRVCKLS